MKINSRLVQWLLVLFFFILSFSIYLFKVIPLKKEKKENFIIENINPSEIASLEIIKYITNSEERIVFTNNQKWQITFPFKEEADEGRIYKLIEELNSSKIENEITNFSNLNEYRLDPPIVKISFILKNSTKKELLIGEETIDGKYRYIYNPQYPHKVMLSYSYKLETPFLKISDFRNKIIFNIPVDEVEKITLKSPNILPITLIKTNNIWQIIKKNSIITVTNFNEKIVDIYSLMIDTFLENQKIVFKPFYEITLISKNRTNILFISTTNVDGKWIAKLSEKKELFLIEKDDLTNIFRINSYNK